MTLDEKKSPTMRRTRMKPLGRDRLGRLEVWCDIQGYGNTYQVSNLGRVRSLPRQVKRSDGFKQFIAGKILSQNPAAGGYLKVNLCWDNNHKYVSVHRLVAEAFLPNPDNLPEVNHIDGNKENNCVENLEWVSRRENAKHAYDIGLMPDGHYTKMAAIAGEEHKKKVVCLDDGRVFDCAMDAADALDVPPSCVSLVCHGKRKHTKGWHLAWLKQEATL